MEYVFVACSQKIGTLREIGPVTQKQLIITMYGSWIPEEDADVILEREYPVYCPVEKKFKLRPHVVYSKEPNRQQLKLKP
jgi:hypothetical protein